VSGEYAFSFSGGALCLDFVNTMSGARARPEERLNTYLDLVSWGRQAGLLTEREAQRLGRAVRLRPADAARMLEEARALREALFRIFQAAIDRRPPSGDDLDVLNAALSAAHSHLRLKAGGSGFEWGWTDAPDALDRMLWPVVRSAVELLTSPQRSRLHICESPTCDWLFLDMSRNRSRRWCDMRDCGNRAKARRYYARHKSENHSKRTEDGVFGRPGPLI
jgi:predicted RNA-binding Zn ribbon-like protein